MSPRDGPHRAPRRWPDLRLARRAPGPLRRPHRRLWKPSVAQGLRRSRGRPASRDGWARRWRIERVEPGADLCALGRVARAALGSLQRSASLVETTQLDQQRAADDIDRRLVAGVDTLEQREASRRARGASNGEGAGGAHRCPGGEPLQQRVQRCDLPPVGLLGRGCAAVGRRDGRLDLEAGRAAREPGCRLAAPRRARWPRDPSGGGPGPAAAPGRPSRRGAPGLGPRGGGTAARRPADLRLLREGLVQRARQSERQPAEIGADRRLVVGGPVALVEQEVNGAQSTASSRSPAALRRRAARSRLVRAAAGAHG